MKVNRADLLNRLVQLKPGISAKGRIAQSESVIFSQGHISSFNDTYLVTVPFDADFEGAVRYAELTDILGKMESEEVDISCKDGQVLIKSGRSKSGIYYEHLIRLPISEVLEAKEGVEMIPLPDGFAKAVKRSAFCASEEGTADVLVGIRIKDGVFTACNGYRAIEIKVPGAESLPEFCLPATCSSFLDKYDLAEIGVSKSWAFLAGKDGLFLCARLIDLTSSAYPDMERIFNADDVREIILPEKLVSAIGKAQVFLKTLPETATKNVCITLKQGQVVLKGEGTYGWYEESVAAKDYQGEEISFQINPDFLADILPLVQKANFVSKNRIIFDGDDFKYVSALVINEG